MEKTKSEICGQHGDTAAESDGEKLSLYSWSSL